ncbi:MAG: methionyl-tRNA formyltransferase [Chloroflexi bacterium]|nr:methionyl-tRNA formyltransferase [Chloroflexota bacterium]
MTDPAAAAGPAGAPVRTVFFGSGAFAVPALRALASAPGVRLVAVVTPPDRPAGRHARPAAVPVAEEARRLGLPHRAMARLRTPEAAASIAADAPTLGVLADFGRIVPPSILAVPARGILNLHPSLLPRHRGAAPVPAAILAGDGGTGITIIRMDEGLDTGPIVARREWPLSGRESAPELEAFAAAEGAALLLQILEPYVRGEVIPVAQPSAGVTLTRPLRREDGRLDPAGPAFELERQVRAYQPWPGAWFETSAGRVAVTKAEVAAGEPGDIPGRLVEDGPGLALATAAGRLRLLEVQPAGGRPMPAEAFRRGRPAIVGMELVRRQPATARP